MQQAHDETPVTLCCATSFLRATRQSSGADRILISASNLPSLLSRFSRAFHALLLGNDAFYGKEASWTRGSLGILSMDGQVKDHPLEAPENDERF